MDHARLFAFEADFVASLRCIPMAVRLKLDRCGIKLSLRQWSRFTLADRHSLLIKPCGCSTEIEAYGAMLVDLIAARSREEPTRLSELALPLWEAAGATPTLVTDFARSMGVSPPSSDEWRGLSELERFTLIKLTRDNHDNVNFLPAMREFGLLGAESEGGRP